MEMHARRPKTLNEFEQITGVGQSKLQRYGTAFIAVISAEFTEEFEDVMM